MGMRRLKKRLVCEAEEWLDHDLIVNQVKKIKKASPPDCDYIIVNCLVEAFNRVHPECKISMDITPRIIEKMTPVWSEYYASVSKNFSVNPQIHSIYSS